MPQSKWALGLGLGLLTALAGVGCAPEVRTIAEPVSFPEGPCYSTFDKQLYFVEFGADKVLAWDGTQTSQVWLEEGSGPCALLALGPGELLVTCYNKPELAAWFPGLFPELGKLVRIRDGRTVETITKDSKGNPFDGPNDLTRGPRGDIYFTASGEWTEAAVLC